MDTGCTADWAALGVAVRLVVSAPHHLAPAARLLRAELRRIDESCSRFRSDSELSRLNAGDGRPQPVSPALAEAIAVALRAARLTGGLVDPTVGQAMNDLGYDRDFASILPSADARVVVHRPAPGWEQIIVDPSTGAVTLPVGVQLDLGATAKALAADRAATRIAAEQGCAVLVGLGGDISVAGDRGAAGGWPVRVQDVTGHPTGIAVGPTALIRIQAGGLATSSTASRRWVHGGERRHHIVDPLTGVPANSPWRTVSVAAGSCVDANMAATGAIVCGWTAPAWLAERDLSARLVRIDGRVETVGGWPSSEPMQVPRPERVSA